MYPSRDFITRNGPNPAAYIPNPAWDPRYPESGPRMIQRRDFLEYMVDARDQYNARELIARNGYDPSVWMGQIWELPPQPDSGEYYPVQCPRCQNMDRASIQDGDYAYSDDYTCSGCLASSGPHDTPRQRNGHSYQIESRGHVSELPSTYEESSSMGCARGTVSTYGRSRRQSESRPHGGSRRPASELSSIHEESSRVGSLRGTVPGSAHTQRSSRHHGSSASQGRNAIEGRKTIEGSKTVEGRKTIEGSKNIERSKTSEGRSTIEGGKRIEGTSKDLVLASAHKQRSSRHEGTNDSRGRKATEETCQETMLMYGSRHR